MLAQSPEGSLRRRKATDEDGPGFGTCIGSRHDHRLPRTAAQSAWQRAPGFASRTVLYLRGTGGHRGKKKRGWTIRAQYEADGVAGQYPRSDVGGVLGSRWGWPPGRAGLIRGVEDFTSSNVVHRAMRQATSATPTQAQSHVASTSPKEVRSDLTVNRSLIDVQQGFFQGKMREDCRTPKRWRVGHSRSNLRQVLVRRPCGALDFPGRFMVPMDARNRKVQRPTNPFPFEIASRGMRGVSRSLIQSLWPNHFTGTVAR